MIENSVVLDNLITKINTLSLEASEINLTCQKIFKSKLFLELVSEIKRCLYHKKRIVFVSDNSLATLCLEMESSWKKFWIDLINLYPDRKEQFVNNANVIKTIISAGDANIIKGYDFKNNNNLALYQLENASLHSDDCIVILNDDGLSKYNNALALKASISNPVYYFYNNSKDKLLSDELGKKVINNKRIIKVSLYQKDNLSSLIKETLINLVINVLLEEVINEWLKENLTDEEYKVIVDNEYVALNINDYSRNLCTILKSLSKDKGLKGIAKFKESVDDLINKEGNVTFITNKYLLICLSFILSHQQTNNLPAFRKYIDRNAKNSFAYVKDPIYPSYVAWQHALYRSSIGIDASKTAYKSLGLNDDFSSSAIYDYLIGYEDDPSRYKNKYSSLLLLSVNEEIETKELDWFGNNANLFSEASVIRIGNNGRFKLADNEILIPVKINRSCLDVLSKIVVKIILNLVFNK